MPARRLFAMLIGMVVAVLVVASAFYKLRIHAWRIARTNDFKIVMFGLHSYDSLYGQLPPSNTVDGSGNEACSWRFVVRPFCDTVHIQKHDYSLPWDTPANAVWESTGIGVFVLESQAESLETSIFAICGEGTGFPDQAVSMRDLPHDLVLIVEVRNSRTHWMEPGDFEIGDIPRRIGGEGTCISGVNGDGFVVGFADGTVWILGKETPFDELSTFFTTAGAAAHEREESLAKYRLR